MFFSFRFSRRLTTILCALCLALFIGGSFGWHRAATAAQASAQRIALPIIMYHGILKDTSRQGKYVISPALLESDISYLKERGYTPVFMQQVVDYVKSGVPLPEKPIVLSFDDGYYNNYTYAFPLAQKYGVKLVIAPILTQTEQFSKAQEENANYGHITWDNMREMVASGHVEIQNHTYNLHQSSGNRLGVRKISGETSQHYKTLLINDLQTAQTEITKQIGVTPTTFVYPFGAFSSETEDYVRQMGFQATFTCESQINYLTSDPDCLFGLGRYLRTNEKTSVQFFQSILPD